MSAWLARHFMYLSQIKEIENNRVHHCIFNFRYPMLNQCTPYSTSRWGTAGNQKVYFFPEDQRFYPKALQVQFCSAIPVCLPVLPSLHLRPKRNRRVLGWSKRHTCVSKRGEKLSFNSNIWNLPGNRTETLLFWFLCFTWKLLKHLL